MCARASLLWFTSLADHDHNSKSQKLYSCSPTPTRKRSDSHGTLRLGNDQTTMGKHKRTPTTSTETHKIKRHWLLRKEQRKEHQLWFCCLHSTYARPVLNIAYGRCWPTKGKEHSFALISPLSSQSSCRKRAPRWTRPPHPFFICSFFIISLLCSEHKTQLFRSIEGIHVTQNCLEILR